jgi:type II secretory pathway pseudopilin PulG
VTRTRRLAYPEAGFTVVELMVVMALTIVLFTLGAFAVRQFWHVRSLAGAQDIVVTQLRQLQQRSMSEGHPNVYGLGVRPGFSDFAVVRGSATTNACTVVNRQLLGDGVLVTANTDFGTASTMAGNCATALGTGYKVVLFYPRGIAGVGGVPGQQRIELSQPAIGRTRAIQVTPLTGRVTRV